MESEGRQQPAMDGEPDSSAAAASTMQAITQDAYGSADVLHLTRIARPEPGDGEVLLRVHAAGLDRGTWHLMTGRPPVQRLVTGLRRPRNRVPGRDVAGTVVALGAGVTRYTVGDEVFGLGKGSFAEYAVAPADKLARKPAGISFTQAAVVPVSGQTALKAVRDAGRVRPGQHVLVTGASGGVGSYAVQLAKAFGAEVTGVASTGKLDLVSSLGADHVLDYTAVDVLDGILRYDVVIDIAGGPAIPRLRRAVTPTGTVVLVGTEQAGDWGWLTRMLHAMALSILVRQRLTSLSFKERGSDVAELAALLEAGQVTPSIDRTYSLDRVPEAMRHLEAGKVRGKVAITV
jgi:NADPH:quinone reductase-like Zn-dependent oxidoreductase